MPPGFVLRVVWDAAYERAAGLQFTSGNAPSPSRSTAEAFVPQY